MLQTSALLGLSLVPQKNRRLLVTVTYLIILLVLTAIVAIPAGHGRYFQLVLSVVFLIPVNVSLYFFGRVVKQTVFPTPHREPARLELTRKRPQPDEFDERDLSVRDAAYFTAYRAVAAYSLFVCLMVWPAFDSGNPLMPLLLVLPLLVFAPTLPQAVILWTEPDVPQEMGT